jgi:Skp family chaperone for outer membrane proteins
MKSLHVATAAFVLASVAAVAALSQQKPPPLQLGFLDVHKAFETYRKVTDLSDQFKARQEGVMSELKVITRQAEELTSRLNQLNSQSEEYQQIEERIQLLKAEYEVKRKARLQGLEVEMLKRRSAIYKELSQEAQVFGVNKGLAAVLLYIPPDVDFGRDLDIYVNTRTVLCRDESLDITKEFVDLLNRQLPPPVPRPVTPPAPVDPNKPK